MISVCRKHRIDLLLGTLVLWFLLSSVSASHYFVTNVALYLKLTYLALIISIFVIGCFLKKLRIEKSAFIGITVTFIGILGSVWTSQFPTRAACDLDIIFAALALGYIIQSCVAKNFINGIRSVGIFLFLFSHFTLCLYTSHWNPTQLQNFWHVFFLNALSNPFAVLHDIFCPHGLLEQPFGYSNFAALFAAMLCPFFMGLFL